MSTPSAAESPPSLVAITVRRSFMVGRIYTVVGLGYSVVFELILGFTSASSFSTAVPLLLPVFAVVGSMGGLAVFTNDRVKGVYEYLLAYGVSSRRLFANVLGACLVLTTISLGVALGIGLGVFVARGYTVSVVFAGYLLLYTLPMSYASVAFAATVGMFWTSLSSPRAGMTSTIGLMPVIGIAPSLLTLVAVGVAPGWAVEVLLAAVGLVAAMVLLLLSLMDRLMPTERLLSPT
jgi:hypothetical protein